MNPKFFFPFHNFFFLYLTNTYYLMICLFIYLLLYYFDLNSQLFFLMSELISLTKGHCRGFILLSFGTWNVSDVMILLTP